MTGLRCSVRALIGTVFCVVFGVPLAVIFLVRLAVTVQMIAWWIE